MLGRSPQRDFPSQGARKRSRLSWLTSTQGWCRRSRRKSVGPLPPEGFLQPGSPETQQIVVADVDPRLVSTQPEKKCWAAPPRGISPARQPGNAADCHDLHRPQVGVDEVRERELGRFLQKDFPSQGEDKIPVVPGVHVVIMR